MKDKKWEIIEEYQSKMADCVNKYTDLLVEEAKMEPGKALDMTKTFGTKMLESFGVDI